MHLEALRRIGDVYENENIIDIIPSKEFSKFSKLFAELEKVGLQEEFVTIKKATLEDVFLHLTGRRLRD